MSETKKAILFTGKIYSPALDLLIEQTKNVKYKFASIWENENPEYISKLSKNNFIIITSSIKQQELFTPQSITIVNGLNYIKKHEFDFVLRTRFDVLSTDYVKYLELSCDLSPDKITVIAGIHTDPDGSYFLDIVVSGKTDNMCQFYIMQPVNDKRYCEKFIIENYSKKTNLKKDDIKDIFNFSLSFCLVNSIEFIWYRNDSWKTNYITIPDMKVINEYCKSSFIWF
jgi:hypothetical protein